MQSDIILALGSHDIRVADKAAELWNQGWAKYILFSGKSGVLTAGKWQKSEAEIFHERAVGLGVTNDSLIIETHSTNTGENIRFSHKIMTDMELMAHKLILVQKPYMGRRTLATFEKQWPGKMCTFFVTSPQIGMFDYPNADVGDLHDVITVMVGDMQRIEEYFTKGFQTYQYVPPDVRTALHVLLQSGLYSGHLIKRKTIYRSNK